MEEIEGDLDKINRWFSQIKERDLWEGDARKEVERLINQVEANLAVLPRPPMTDGNLARGTRGK